MNNNSPHSRQDTPAGGGKLRTVLIAAGVLGLGGVTAAVLTTHSPDEAAEVISERFEIDVTAPGRTLSQSLLSAEDMVRERVISRDRLSLQRRDTLSDLLDRAGADRVQANAALYALYDSELIDPRKVQPGLEIETVFELSNNGTDRELAALVIQPDSDRTLISARLADGSYRARETSVRLEPEHRRVAGKVTTSLYAAALDAGAGDQQVVDFAQIFAYDIDFQRELRAGDGFEMVYETLVDERGNPVRSGEIVYAAFHGRFTDKSFYRFTPPDDEVMDYFDTNGESATKFLMKTPINGARLSSSFGMRRHPISGYSRLHKGTDFAAPTGTPVFAAGNGTVERASRYGGYGNYVRIQHANGYETAYAHLSRYGAGIRSGVRVRQGQVIGYVGSTGASTGPHLHYEVLVNGEHVDAMRLKLPTGRKLDGEILGQFETVRDDIDALRVDLGHVEPETAPLPRDGGAMPR